MICRSIPRRRSTRCDTTVAPKRPPPKSKRQFKTRTSTESLNAAPARADYEADRARLHCKSFPVSSTRRVLGTDPSSSSAPSSHLGERSSLVVLGVACAGSLAVSVILIAGWHAFVPDDVYFYLKIADSLYRGLGSTFNGLTLTNGYHPLWMGFTVLARALGGADPRSYIRVHLVLCALGNVAALVLSRRVARALGLRGDVAPVLIAVFVSFNFVGSEQHVSLPLLMASVLVVTRLIAAEETRARSWIGSGVLLGLTLLARLDNVFAMSGLALVAAGSGAGRATIVRRALWLGAGALVCILPYLLWNVLHFGHLEPISGAIKSALAGQVGWNPGKLGRQGMFLTLAALCAPPLGFTLWRTRQQLAANGFMLGVALHALYVVWRLEGVWTWYFAGELIVLALLLERARAELNLRLIEWLLPLAAALVLFHVVRVKRTELMGKSERPFYLDTAAYIDAHTAEREGTALCCSPGAVGFFSHRPVFALDGLTGDYAFHALAADRGLYEALEEIGVRYVITLGPQSSELPVLIRMTAERGHGGEAVSFAGKVDDDGTARPTAVGLFSPLEARSVGWLRTDMDNLVGSDFSARDWALWRLSPVAPEH